MIALSLLQSDALEFMGKYLGLTGMTGVIILC